MNTTRSGAWKILSWLKHHWGNGDTSNFSVISMIRFIKNAADKYLYETIEHFKNKTSEVHTVLPRLKVPWQ